MNELSKRILSSLILLPLTIFFIINGSYFLIFFILLFFFVSIYEWHMMTKNNTYKIYGFIFLMVSFYTFYEISSDTTLTFFLISICISTDIGGFVFGKIFKGPKLTKISPKKTYSGMIGGYFLSLINSFIFLNILNYSIEYNHIFILTLAISTLSQIGDIIVSYFKRLIKIKDTGNLIPGHGGVLDRIDGMIFVFPFFFLINFLVSLNL